MIFEFNHDIRIHLENLLQEMYFKVTMRLWNSAYMVGIFVKIVSSSNPLMASAPHHIETSQLIYRANQENLNHSQKQNL